MRILLLSTFILSFLTLFSQNLLPQNSLEECGTITSDLDYAKRLEMKMRNSVQNSLSLNSSNSGPITFAVAHHIFLTNDGNPNSNGINSSKIPIIIRNLNEEFNQFNIYFETVCIDVHNNSRLNDIILNRNEIVPYQTENAINIYYTASGSCGSASLPWRDVRYVSLRDNCALTSTAAHELGHFLGLFHTFGDTYSCGDELVDGSNCATTGDFICDTPADPQIQSKVNSSCQFIGNSKCSVDANGDEYDPDVENYMSYAPRDCRTEFTPLQKDEMQFWANSEYFEDYILDGKWNFKIKGPAHICANKTISLTATKFNFPYHKLTWTSSSNLSVISNSNGVRVSRIYRAEAADQGQSKNNQVNSNSNSTKGWVEASYTPYCGEKRTVRHEIWIEKPEIRFKTSWGSCEDRVLVYEALPSGLNYTWFASGGINFSSSGNLAMISGNGISAGETESFSLTARSSQNGCTFSNSLSSSYSVSASCGSGPCLSGNCPCPISDPNCNSDFHQMSTLGDEIWIHNTSNELVFHGNNQVLDDQIKNLSKGLYVITTREGSTVSKKKILVGDN